MENALCELNSRRPITASTAREFCGVAVGRRLKPKQQPTAAAARLDSVGEFVLWRRRARSTAEQSCLTHTSTRSLLAPLYLNALPFWPVSPPPSPLASQLTHRVSPTESSEHEDKSTDASGDAPPPPPPPQCHPTEVPSEVPREVPRDDGLSPKISKPEDDELGPLPDNWEMAYTEKGEVYFIE